MIKIPNYNVKEVLGQGGMSTVYLAEQIFLGRDIALKVMSPELAIDENYRKAFLSEGKIIAKLEHPNIIRVHDVNQVNDTIVYMAMEQLEGGSLKDRLALGALDSSECFSIFEQISRGLAYAHKQGYIHRDIKPGNILFHKNGSAIITDFGIAKLQNTRSDMTLMGNTVGTVRYMSPEQALGEETDQRSDIYSLAVVFYEMLTGEKLYKSHSTLQVIQQHASKIPKLPEQYSFLQRPLNKALAQDKKKRYQTMQEFSDAIKNTLSTDETVIHGSLLHKKTPKPLYKKNQFWGGITAVALLSLVTYLGLQSSIKEVEGSQARVEVEPTSLPIKPKTTTVPISEEVAVEQVSPEGVKKLDETATEKTTNKIIPTGKLAQYAGIRISDYGIDPFPTKARLEEFAYNMSSGLESKTPAVLLIVGGIQEEDKVCHLSFPIKKKIKNVTFEAKDKYESYLKHFDETGVKVFLQVESGDADMPTLIRTVLNRYQHHPSVVGFGVDIEWYKPNNKKTGRKVSNKEAKSWESIVKSYKHGYSLFLKHWGKETMPSKYRGDIIFVDDSQEFPDFKTFKKQVAEWIAAFPKNRVFFQYGYKVDKIWWSKLENPPIDIANAIKALDSKAGVFWVDFTINDLQKEYNW